MVKTVYLEGFDQIPGWILSSEHRPTIVGLCSEGAGPLGAQAHYSGPVLRAQNPARDLDKSLQIHRFDRSGQGLHMDLVGIKEINEILGQPSPGPSPKLIHSRNWVDFLTDPVPIH